MSEGIRKLRMRDAVVSVYLEQTRPCDIESKYPGVSRRTITEIAAKIDAGLVENERQMQVTRAANDAVKIDAHGLYTEWELQQAVEAVQSDRLKPWQATAAYGVPPSTLRKKRKALVQIAGENGTPSANAVAKAARTVSKGKKGPKPYLEGDEEEVFLAVADQIAAEGLPGRDRSRLSKEGKKLCMKLAEGEPDERKRKRLQEAECGWNWVKRLLDNKDNSVVAAGGTMKKQSQMSTARAKAKNPAITAEMFKRIEAMYADHYARGILKTPQPASSQIYGGDEIGMNPHGHKGKQVFCSFFRKQIVVVVDGEGGKAPFWVTFFFWTRADGQFPIPPCVVHQAAQLSEFHALNLPLDWCVHASDSGYMDRDGWFKVAVHFQKWCGPLRPQYLFFDAHDSHWDSDALKLWSEDQLFPFFLRAHGSEDDQINDNGPNAKFHSYYDEETAAWQETHPGVKDTPAYVNSRLTGAWERMKMEGGPTAAKAARITGLYPFNPQAENHTDGLDLVSRKFQLGAPWRDNAEQYAPEWQAEQEGPRYKLIQARTAAPERALLIRAKAAEYVETTHVIPAMELQEEIRKHKQAKKNKVTTKPNRMNPDTTYGMSVTEEVLKEAAGIQKNRDVATAQAIVTKKQSEGRRVARRHKKSESFELVVLTIAVNVKPKTGLHGFVWGKLVGNGGVTTTDKLKLALQEWVGDDAHPKYCQKMKSADVVTDFEHRFKCMLVAYVIACKSLEIGN